MNAITAVYTDAYKGFRHTQTMGYTPKFTAVYLDFFL